MKRILSFFIAVLLFVTMLPTVAFAQGEDRSLVTTYEENSTIAPGVTQKIARARKKYNNQQLVYYTMTVDTKVETAHIYANYKDNDWKSAQEKNYGLQTVMDQLNAAQERHGTPDTEDYIKNYTVVGGINGTGYTMATGETRGILVMEGNIVHEDKVNSSSISEPFFAIDKEGKPHIYWNEYGKDWAEQKNNIKEAINSYPYNGQGTQILIKDGQINESIKNVNAPNARTAIGVTEDDKVVMLVVDGKQAPTSEGCDMYELAEILLDAGCQSAINLDGGGSSTFISRPEGKEELEIINSPCDQYPRAVSASLMVVSTVPPSNVFVRASIRADHEYITPGGTVNLTATGISPAGTPVALPESVTWAVKDGVGGTVSGEGGSAVFTASDQENTVTVQMLDGGQEVGTCTVNVVKPTKLTFSAPSYAVPFGETIDIGFNTVYQTGSDEEYDVTTHEGDIELSLEADPGVELGTLNGFRFTARDRVGDKSTTVSGKLNATCLGQAATAELTVGRGSEVIFDFEEKDDNNRLSNFECNLNKQQVKMSAEIVDKDHGKVHDGDKAMKVQIDYSDMVTSAVGTGTTVWQVFMNYLCSEIDITGATGYGYWIWIPDEDTNLAAMVRIKQGGKGAAATLSKKGLAHDEGYWYYAYYDLTGFTTQKLTINPQFFSIMMYTQPIDTPAIKSANNIYTYYIDSFTVDYSSVVPDRGLPVFGDVQTVVNGDQYETLTRGEIYDCGNRDTVRFQTSVSDAVETGAREATGIQTVEAYIDGIDIGATFNNGMMATNEVTLAPGVHTLKLYATDGAGNTTNETRRFRINDKEGIATVKVEPSEANNKKSDQIPIGSVYWLDVTATDMSKVETISMDLDLNNISVWELDHAEVNDKFDFAWNFADDYAKSENIATITLTRNTPWAEGDSDVAASLPIRTWTSSLEYDISEGTKATPENIWAYVKSGKRIGAFFPVDITVEIDRGEIEFTEGYSQAALPVFGGRIQVDTELYDYAEKVIAAHPEKSSWHIHSTAEAVADIPATCTTKGYTDRKVCPECGSPVTEEDWGHVVEALGHQYEDVDGVRKCTRDNNGQVCGDLFNGEYDGKTYVDGKVVGAEGGAWNGDSYYVDGHKLTGIQKIKETVTGENQEPQEVERYYDFGTDGVCKGKTPLTSFVKEAEGILTRLDGEPSGDDCKGTVLYILGGEIQTGWIDAGEDRYHAGTDGHIHGKANVRDSRTCVQNGYLYYTCPTCKAQSQSEALWSKGHDWDADHVCKVCHFHGIDIANAEFSVGGNFKYTGKPIPAAFTLTYQGRTLNVRSDRYGTDGYSEYSNNVDVGIGDVRIDGRGDFYGSKFGHFTIVPESVSEVTMTQEAGHKITLSWKPALGAGYYEVVIPDETIANKYTVLGKTEDTTFTTDQFKVGDAYKLRVASRTLVGDTIYYCSFWSNTIEGIIEHEWGEPEVGSVLPTCDKPGSVNRTCELCGEHEDNAEIPPLGHKVETWTTTVEPTYSSVGQKTGECTVCHQTVTEEIPRLQYTGSGGSTAPGTHQETVTNPDGSKTTTTTKPDGSKTETTTMPDGTVTEKDTAKDGSVTERTTTPEGVTGQVDTNSKGDVTSAEVVIPKEAEDQDVVTAPVEVPASKNAADAPEITVKTESGQSVTVEIPVTEYGPGTVAVVVNPDGTEEIVRDCVIGENGVVLNVEGDITLKIVDNTETFTDVEPVHHWATDAVEFVAARELFRGTGNHEFTPNGEMTRGMLVTVLYRLAYEPEAAMDDFTDVDPDAYYADAVSWAGRNGIVTGYSDTEFGPNDDVTREQLVTILYRYAEKNGYLTGQSGSLNGYADADNVSDWAAEAMGWAVEIGLVKGVDANHLAPSADATRAEVATIMMRFCEAIIK